MRTRFWICLMLAPVLLAACAGNRWDEEVSTVVLERDVIFVDPSGSTQLVAAGTYEVEQSDGNTLALMSTANEKVIRLPAEEGDHEENIGESVVFIASDEDGTPHLLLLRPGGKTLDVGGTYAVVAERGARRGRLRRPARLKTPRISFEFKRFTEVWGKKKAARKKRKADPAGKKKKAKRKKAADPTGKKKIPKKK